MALIIKIDVKLSQLTINMEIRISWIEKDRLLLVTNQNEWILISESNIQKLIWSPKIVVRKLTFECFTFLIQFVIINLNPGIGITLLVIITHVRLKSGFLFCKHFLKKVMEKKSKGWPFLESKSRRKIGYSGKGRRSESSAGFYFKRSR